MCIDSDDCFNEMVERKHKTVNVRKVRLERKSMLLKIRLLINQFYFPLVAVYALSAVSTLIAVITSRSGQYGTMIIAGQEVAAFPVHFWFTAGWVLFFSTAYFIIAKRTQKEWKKYWKRQKRVKC